MRTLVRLLLAAALLLPALAAAHNRSVATETRSGISDLSSKGVTR